LKYVLKVLDKFSGEIIVSALRFAMTPRQVTVVVPGINRTSHIDMIKKAMLLGPLDHLQIRKINKLVPCTYTGWNQDC